MKTKLILLAFTVLASSIGTPAAALAQTVSASSASDDPGMIALDRESEARLLAALRQALPRAGFVIIAIARPRDWRASSP